ncbi:MAG: endonuclease I [Desulfovibrio piger]|uniref:endonuclease I family protein n=1 Tax=Desulfovibrio piger TaxID=901 RepID=UPI00095E63D8|nr:endonuclease [Desulfovibrio piger]OLA87104.1 MAG: endonuclease I [Desulfovibrio piger]
MKRIVWLLWALLLVLPAQGRAAGNMQNESFAKAKRLLEQEVYYDHRQTLYCGAFFDAHKQVELPQGFTTDKHQKRSARVEWEHVVPAENFGRAFSEWREGHALCVDRKGKTFRGRACAEKVNADYRRMQADMYNLYPAIGSVNAVRSNKNFQMLGPGVPSAFGSCPMKVSGNKVEPPERARGQIARSSLYMADSYAEHYRLSRQQRQLMQVWARQYPVDAWECRRASRIERLQGNENRFVKEPCLSAGLWPEQESAFLQKDNEGIF